MQRQYTIFPVSQHGRSIMEVKGYRSLLEIGQPIDTVTVYLNPMAGERVLDDIIAVRPGRVIFNPGTESESIFERLDQAGIRIITACTLVLLNTGQFDRA